MKGFYVQAVKENGETIGKSCFVGDNGEAEITVGNDKFHIIGHRKWLELRQKINELEHEVVQKRVKISELNNKTETYKEKIMHAIAEMFLIMVFALPFIVMMLAMIFL